VRLVKDPAPHGEKFLQALEPDQFTFRIRPVVLVTSSPLGNSSKS
jgi:hypothetical protein